MANDEWEFKNIVYIWGEGKIGFKKFRRDNFFYGYKSEAVFQQTFPEAKKLVNEADFKLGDYYVEIGRSRVLEFRTIVYFRKLFYNIIKDKHPELKKMDPDELFAHLRGQPNDTFKTTPDKFLFCYFTHGMKHFILFDYNDVLMGELNRKKGGEPIIIVKNCKLNKIHKLKDIVYNKVGLVETDTELDLGGFGCEFSKDQFYK